MCAATGNHWHFATALLRRPLEAPICPAAAAIAFTLPQSPLFAAASAARVARPPTTALQSCFPLGSLQLLKLLAAPAKLPDRAAARHASHAPPPPPLAGWPVVLLSPPLVEVFGGSGGFGVPEVWDVGLVDWGDVVPVVPDSVGLTVSVVAAVSVVGGDSGTLASFCTTGPP